MSELRDHYVSLRRGNGDRARYSLLAGPFDTHEEALKFVDPARREASRLDAWTDFDYIGTCSILRRAENKNGFINTYLGVTPRSLEPKPFIPIRKSIPTADVARWWNCGWAYVVPDFDRPDHSIIEWLSAKVPAEPESKKESAA